ncbi:Phy-3p [Parelaphostrongylus tenuis]|uniref:Phy-3p n=1 Tax=Parelaphostrongylus tenuis TaxID=148309 RepID=A0AAD5R9W5_PARTN|nr:Phy-3p [Parelaphostrongylus tenuis]
MIIWIGVKSPRSQDYEYADFFCLTYFWNYIEVRVEFHSFEPVIIVYRNLLSRAQVDRFLADIKLKQENERSHGLPANQGDTSTSRPKEITMTHRESNGAAIAFDQIQTFIPVINLTVSEPWQILSYTAGAHYPPRYDFLNNTKDTFTQQNGNRFATLMILLKKAKKLGHTIFPAYNITIELEEGDAALWTNMNGEGQKSVASIHGDCEVLSGEKVTASLRIRSKNQFLIKTSGFAGTYDMLLLARPRLDIRRLMKSLNERDDIHDSDLFHETSRFL